MTLLVLAAGCGLALTGVVLSFLALFIARSSAQAAAQHRAAFDTRLAAALEMMQSQIAGLSVTVRDLEAQPATNVVPPMPRAAFNLAKRSQALRMHRHGDRPEQIAAALELPLQEVELLLRIHRLVISTV